MITHGSVESRKDLYIACSCSGHDCDLVGSSSPVSDFFVGQGLFGVGEDPGEDEMERRRHL